MSYWMRTSSNERQREWARIGHETLERLNDIATANGVKTYTTVEDDLNFGAYLWEKSYKFTKDDEDAIRLIADIFYRGGNETFAAFGSPDFQIYATWCAKWAHHAFPQIILGSKLTAAFMTSAANNEVKESMNPPWDAFLIRIPDNLIYTNSANNERVWFDHIRVCRTKDKHNVYKWSWTANSFKSNLSLWQIGMKPTQLDHDTNEIFQSEQCRELFGDIEQLDDKVSRLIGRIIIGTCLSFTNYQKPIGNSKKITPPKNGGYCKNDKQEPLIRSYEIRPPIKVDCREAVKEYLEENKNKKTNGSGPKIQFMVRGHYRLPPGGGKGVKDVWVRPYWKGPERANIAVRTHESNQQ